MPILDSTEGLGIGLSLMHISISYKVYRYLGIEGYP